MGRSANVQILYLPQRNGLNLSSLTSIYKRLQVSKACQLLTSADPTVRRIAEKNLLSELSAKRRKFLPAVVIQQVMQTDPGLSRTALVAVAKRFIRAEENDICCKQLHNQPKQGQYAGTCSFGLCWNLEHSNTKPPPKPVKVCPKCQPRHTSS